MAIMPIVERRGRSTNFGTSTADSDRNDENRRHPGRREARRTGKCETGKEGRRKREENHRQDGAPIGAGSEEAVQERGRNRDGDAHRRNDRVPQLREEADASRTRHRRDGDGGQQDHGNGSGPPRPEQAKNIRGVSTSPPLRRRERTQLSSWFFLDTR